MGWRRPVDFPRQARKTSAEVKRLIFLILVLVLGCCAARAAGKEKKHYVLYAMFLANTRVQLAEGSEWIMGLSRMLIRFFCPKMSSP